MTSLPDRTFAAPAARRCGALSRPGGSTLFRVWAPRAGRVDVVLLQNGTLRIVPLRPEEGDAPDHGRGYFSATVREIPDGQRYVLRLDGKSGPHDDRPDPCSLWQPDGIPGPSALFRTDTFRWTDQSWRGIARADLVIYELHVGTFTREGTFDAIIPRLRELRDLGVTALELMPVAQFPGSRNWGYDGVLPYAAQHSYGGPAGLQRLVDAAHREGLAVLLDVVYNHLGPEGNYLHEFGPYFTDAYKTPWGAAVNYDAAGSTAVRDFVLDNVRMWLEEFHLDGLRLDAIHAIYDLGARHILRSITDVAREVSSRLNRPIHVIGESDLNDPRVLHEPERGGLGLDAQWADDFHHAVHALLTGERRGYYSDYGDAAHLAESLRTPFVYAWTYSHHRRRKHGLPAGDLPGDRFVVCIQNHDQVGNRARGDRLSTLLTSPAKQRLAASLMLLSPYVPMLFMGEEYGESNPFPFFCSFCGEELLRAVREGRKREFSDFLSTNEQIPDPGCATTFDAAKLSWSWPEGSPQAGLRNLYRDLLTARREWPALRNTTDREVHLHPDVASATVLELRRGRGANALTVYFNLTNHPQPLPSAATGKPLLFSSESPQYTGSRPLNTLTPEFLPYECVVLT